MYLNRINTILLFCFLSWTAFGQSDLERIQTDFQQIINKMDSSQSVSINVDAKVYNKVGGTLISATKAKRSEDKNHSKVVLGELEIIETPKYSVRVDHEEHAILVVAKQSPKKGTSGESVDLDFKELLKLIKSQDSPSKPVVKMVSNSGGIRKYKITGLSGLKSTEMEVNMNNLTIYRIAFEYGAVNEPGQFVQLIYDIKYNIDVTTVFSLSNYFTVKNNELVLSPQLKGYKLYTEE